MSLPATFPLAVACSLSSSEMPARLREISALGAAALLDTKVESGRATLRFAARDGVRERIDAIVATEADCCGFLRFDVQGAGNEIVLRVSTHQDAQLVLEEFADAFAAQRDAAA